MKVFALAVTFAFVTFTMTGVKTTAVLVASASHQTSTMLASAE